MNKKIQDALNEQINKEFYSAYLYLAMAAYSEDQGFAGIANWYKVQAQEESEHAMKFYTYIFRRGGKVTLEAIDKPKSNFKSIKETFKETLQHEKLVTESIHNLVKITKEENDYATESFLKWFVDEQVEEEENATDLLQKIEMIGDGPAMYLFDKELAARKYSPETEEKE